MIKMLYRTCLLAALSVLNCVGAAAPSATRDAVAADSGGTKGDPRVTHTPSLQNCGALADKGTCKKKDRSRVNKWRVLQ